MFETLIAILGIVLTLLIVIGIHEAAHFFAARLVGVKVIKFSLGFGKPLLKWYDRQHTEYALGMIPLGGYVKMLDETEMAIKPEELPYSYSQQTYWKKFLIIAAGPLANLICAFALYWLILFHGVVTIKPIIGEIKPHSIAARAGFKVNDEIKAIDSQPMHGWAKIMFALLWHAGDKDVINIAVQRGNKNLTINMLSDKWQLDSLKPDPLLSLGIVPKLPMPPLIIGYLDKNSNAAAAGLKLDDKLLTLNQQPIRDWEHLSEYIYHHPGAAILLGIQRGKQQLQIPLTVASSQHLLAKNSGKIGIAPPAIALPANYLTTIKYNFWPAATAAWLEIKNLSLFNLLLFKKLLTGKMSFKSLGGPITIFSSAGQALNNGWLAFISFLAFLNISVGIINLLPIPGLDGGHLLLQSIATIYGKALPDRLLIFLYQAGFACLIFLMVNAVINDILRLN